MRRVPVVLADLHTEYSYHLARAGLPTVFVFEGGYAVAEVGVNAVNVLQGFEQAASTAADPARHVADGTFPIADRQLTRSNAGSFKELSACRFHFPRRARRVAPR